MAITNFVWVALSRALKLHGELADTKFTDF